MEKIKTRTEVKKKLLSVADKFLKESPIPFLKSRDSKSIRQVFRDIQRLLKYGLP